MKRRLLTSILTGAIGIAGGIGVAIWQHKQDHMLGIALVCGLVGFFFGLVFKVTVE